MNILFFSDSKYEYQAKSLIESALKNIKGDFNLVYYTIGFKSAIECDRLYKVVYPRDPEAKCFELYKPSIMLDAISRFGGDLLFLDTDILIGRRFEISRFVNHSDIPLFPYGNWDYPFLFDGFDENGSHVNFANEQPLMEYFGVKERSMNYIYTCVCAFNERCEDILVEWKSMCENGYLLRDFRKYYPFKDETPANIILWRRKASSNLGRVYLNTIQADPLIYIEENEGVRGDAYNMGIFGNPNMQCENSSDIMLYHGIKEAAEIDSALKYMKSR